MIFESVASAVKEVAEKAAEKMMETAEALAKEVESLPEQIGELSEVSDLPEEIGEKLDLDNLPDEIDKDYLAQMDGKNLNEATDKTNMHEAEDPEKSEKKGGSYEQVFKEGEGGFYEVHHMPADSTSDLERNDGPAIKMEKADHRQTASCGNSREAREYRAQQKELIEQGKFREALQMDIDDIHEKFGNKYDDAISEMLEYVDKLEAEGKING